MRHPLIRHAAALALVGWYLMVPPWKGNQEAHDWEVLFGPFDSAAKCEAVRKFEVNDWLPKERANPPTDPFSGNPMDLNAYFDAMSHLECVASGDPRLSRIGTSTP